MQFLIYFLSSCCFTCATFVIGIINPIHSILLLILVFFFGSILLLILNVEFFALIFLIVYVGAIAVLFLFMVMTLDIKISNVSQKFQDFFSYKSVIVFLILLNLFIFLNEDYIYLFSNYDNISYLNTYLDYSKVLKYDSHLEVLGKALFKEYILPFLFCGFILFIAMVGAIVVTVEDTQFKSVKQQDLINQAYRISENSIFNFKFYTKKIKKLY
jgi:NADH-quinone oxidoreductase subunit J